MKLLWASYLGFAALMTTGAAALAQGPDGAPGPGPGGPGFGMHRPPMEQALGVHGSQGRWWNNPDMIQKLQLTDEQRKAMDQILLDHRAKLIDQRAAVEKAELALEPMLSEDQPNESQVLAQIDKVVQARGELEKANARFLLSIRKQLTAEQWKQLQAAQSARMQRRWGQGGVRNQTQPPVPPGGPQGLLHQLPPPDHDGFAPALGDR